MPRQHKTLLLPGNEVSTAEESLQHGHGDTDEGTVLAGPFEARFNDGHVLTVTVESATPPKLIARLTNQHSELVEQAEPSGCIDQDYCLYDGNAAYELTILRAANTVLTAENADAYNRSIGDHCPACHSSEIDAGRPEVDGPSIRVRVECCACGARWVDTYSFTGISTAEDDFEGPSQNVARQQGQ